MYSFIISISPYIILSKTIVLIVHLMLIAEPYGVLYKDQLADLREMGFFRFKKNLQALIATEGNGTREAGA